MREVVKVNNEKEWNYVVSKLGFKQFEENIHRYNKTFRWIKINEFGYNDNYQLYERQGYNIISFEEFKSRYEPQLKIGDTFEKDGFVCEVKEKIKEPILVGDWIRNDRNMFFKYEKWMLDSPLWVKITNKDFIKQLEDNAK